jgi:hypothetical protein
LGQTTSVSEADFFASVQNPVAPQKSQKSVQKLVRPDGLEDARGKILVAGGKELDKSRRLEFHEGKRFG